ncbi:MAG: hypothetical protein AAGF60_11220 [Pseudomonadota bacterium]
MIRIGKSRGLSDAKIAAFLGRERTGIYKQVQMMREAGTLENLPLGFVVDEIAAAINAGPKAVRP